MALFTSTSPCGGGSGSSGTFRTLQYDYAIRFSTSNTIFLRVNGGFGVFSNVAPDILPCDVVLEKMVVSADASETDAFTADVYRNGVLVYSLLKPLGNPSAVQVGGMPGFLVNDAISVRVSGITTSIDEPKVTLVFGTT